MRIFKNRGDIFFSKTDREKSTEQKILIFSLIAIVILTAIFVTITAVKNDFSAKKFFEPDNLNINSQQEISNDIALPQVNGKTNYLVMVGEKKTLLFAYMLQVDLDNTSYKLSTLKADTIIDGNSLSSIYAQGINENCMKAVNTLIGEDFDYYIAFERDKFVDVFDEFGAIKYPLIEKIKYKSNGKIPYSIRLKDGEQILKGSKVVDLVRYYIDNEKYSLANDLLLNCLSQQNNGINYAKADQLFNLFIKNSTTNITVKNYIASDKELMVLSSERTSVKLYNAPIKYDNNKITDDSLGEVKGYFAK